MNKRTTPSQPTCASCGHCSLHGQFCNLGGFATDLSYSCDNHTKSRLSK